MGDVQTAVRQYNSDEKFQFNGHGMLRRSAVPLEQLPEGFEFPAELRDRISYDLEQRLLVFRGFMSSADYCFLRTSSNDIAYLRALEELHEKSAFEIDSRPRIVPLWLWALVAAAFVLAGLVWLGWLMGSE